MKPGWSLNNYSILSTYYMLKFLAWTLLKSLTAKDSRGPDVLNLAGPENKCPRRRRPCP
jgi:hypothetical protein